MWSLRGEDGRARLDVQLACRSGSPLAADQSPTIGLRRSRAAVSASSSRQPRTRSIASERVGGPARCRIRVCPSSARWRTADRAPRYWSIDTIERAAPRRRGRRRRPGRRGRGRAPAPAPRRRSTTRTIASTRWRSSASTTASDRRGVVGRRADRLDVVPRGARREVEVHRDRGRPVVRDARGRPGRWCGCAG